MDGTTATQASRLDQAAIEARIDDFETRILENAIIHSKKILSNESIIRFRDELHEAVEFARKAHEGQFRKNGEPYIFHPLNIALDIASNHMADPTTIFACLLHDLLEDTHIRQDEIARRFGENVAGVVEGLTKIKNQKIESFEKFFLLSLQYPRILFIKIFDRFHNMRTIEFLPPAKQRRIARETMDIYYKICDRLSLMDIADALDQLCNRVLQPGKTDQYGQRVKSLKRHVRTILDVMERKIRVAADDRGVRLVSIEEHWKLFLDRERYEEMAVAEAFRLNLIVEEREDIYRLLGIVNELFIHVRGSINDFISSPKYNNYRSLDLEVVHQGVKYPIGITTTDFHVFNRKGLLTYGFSDDQVKNLEYMRHLEAYLKSETNFRDLEQVFAHHNPEEITVISKDGQPFDMERGSTALDFAFKIHSEVGLRAQYAVVDGRKQPLDTRLDDGDMIRIVTSDRQVVTPESLQWCTNLRSKRIISLYLNRRNRERAETLAKRFLEKKLFAYHIDNRKFWGVYDATKGEKTRQAMLISLYEDKEGVESLLLDLGLISESRVQEIRSMEENFLKRMGLRFLGRGRGTVALEVEYRDDVLLLCPKCVPTLKDSPVALLEHDRLQVHRAGCALLREMTPQRLFPVRWQPSQEKRGALIEIRSEDVYGIFNKISSAFRQARVNIAEHTGQRILDGALFRMRIDDTDEEHLSKLLELLRGTAEIKEIELRS